MKKIFTAFVFCFLCGECFSQAGEWIWVHGDTTAAYSVIYGTQGIPSPANSPSGTYEGCEWTDKQGKFWFFGSTSYVYDNNLWKYDPSVNMWTWMKGLGLQNDTGSYGVQGVPSPNNNPPCRGFGPASWVDTTGNLWLFGGFHYLGQYNTLNDLWRYEISTNTWTWISGSNIPNQAPVYGTQGIPSIFNTPGARNEAACTWTDDFNNLWMFGGCDPLGEHYNDLWKYSILTNEWTWMKGADSAQALGIYGIQGQANLLNTPGARWCYSNWKDSNGNLWLFGGKQQTTCAYGNLNDLWKYNVSTNEWTWMKGANFPCDTGSTGIKCVSDSSNNPVSRFENRSNWVDNNGNFWMFGGAAFIPPASAVLLNDLWMFNMTDNEWIRVWGDTLSSQFGNYGIMGVSSPCNKPGGAMGSVSWFDANTNSAYVFGGYQYNTGGGGSIRNELWKYTIDTVCLVHNCSSVEIIENKSPKELLVFPNPTNSSLTISFQSSSNQTIELHIYNTLGKQIYFSKEEITKGKFEKEINVEIWSEGIYFLQLKTTVGNINRKIIINH
ncbi:MAG TPA: kelch repeat-containing protein [Bacteroidia bacterium]|nr:kelch repeat-containing protein [Bacteroidia bacterium]